MDLYTDAIFTGMLLTRDGGAGRSFTYIIIITYNKRRTFYVIMFDTFSGRNV
jgi:hypothetical protein